MKDENHDREDGVRIALVLGTSTGGIGRHVRSAAGGLVRRGHRVAVLGPPATEELFGFTGAGARFVPVAISDRPHPAGDVRAVTALRRAVRGADVVHAHGVRAGGLAAAALMGLRRRPPLAVTLHNAPPAGGGPAALAYGVLERVVARRAALVLGVSSDLEARMRELGARRVERALVPAPALPAVRLDAPAVRAELGAAERPLVVVVARLAEQKGLPVLLDAAAGWRDRAPRPLVAIAGDGPLRISLQERIEGEDLPVRLLGHRSDVPALLDAADAVAVPSVWEGQPLAVQEALRAGRPIVAAEVGGIPDMTGPDAAVLVPPGNPGELRDALDRVLSDPELAGRLAAAAALRGSALPAEDDAAGQLDALYRELIC